MDGTTHAMSDYYELLGVGRDADATEIKRAFRRRARELHPDVNPDDPQAEESFRQVTAAYEVLSDDERRAVYDRYGEAGLKQQQWEPQHASFGNIADIFSAFFGDDLMSNFGGRGSAARAAQGENVLVDVSLDFREAALGVKHEVSFEAIGTCETCDGRGAESEAGISGCDTCDGNGVVRSVARSLFGQVIQESICPRCSGRGSIVTVPCSSCAGSGEQPEQRTLTVDIPAGIADGQRIRLTGRGSTSAGGGPPGNLYIDVRVEADDRFVRDGDDLITLVELSLTEAALGCTKQVPTVDGEDEAVDFHPGTQPGEIVTLRDRGVGRLRGGGGGERGDQRLVIGVQVPRDLDAEQRQMLERFQASETEDNYRTDERLLDRLRRMLRS